MSSEEFQNAVLQQLKSISEDQKELRKDIAGLELRMENEVIEKVRILFDANQIQEDRHKEMKKQFADHRKDTAERFADLGKEMTGRFKETAERFTNLEGRLSSIETDTGFLVSKVARLEKIVR